MVRRSDIPMPSCSVPRPNLPPSDISNRAASTVEVPSSPLKTKSLSLTNDLTTKSLDELKKKKIGNIYANEALPIFEKMIKFIRSNNLSEDKNTHIIQLGSSSGRDLEFFLNIFVILDLKHLRQLYHVKFLKQLMIHF